MHRAENAEVSRSSLLEAFAAVWTGRIDDTDAAQVETTLGTIVTSGRAAWPRLDVDDASFVRHLAERAPPTALASTLARYVSRANDLWLAHACLHGSPLALAAFERMCLAGCGSYLRRIDDSPAFTADVAQLVREKLLVGTAEAPPRIAEYAGRGSLASWVRVAVMRTALNLRRARTVELAASDADLDVAVEGDPELAFAKASYREPFAAALRTAAAGLTAQQRTLLRLHYVDRLGIDKIAVVYKVHRSTVARWLADTRDVLHATIRSELRQRLGISGSECESMVSALYSQLTLSLGSLLRTPLP